MTWWKDFIFTFSSCNRKNKEKTNSNFSWKKFTYLILNLSLCELAFYISRSRSLDDVLIIFWRWFYLLFCLLLIVLSVQILKIGWLEAQFSEMNIGEDRFWIAYVFPMFVCSVFFALKVVSDFPVNWNFHSTSSIKPIMILFL